MSARHAHARHKIDTGHPLRAALALAALVATTGTGVLHDRIGALTDDSSADTAPVALPDSTPTD
ncbi:hypothetical protein QZH56_36925 (plasmid) [Streptomyces olivoreticuli]|uniref:hypothetical protein n=1 Tax=Streptomyces olivoreticuli TaxID=68246 RepID=UPI002659A479|nr:hypothetical protein [Streptomyces olivoreticuli]WKK27838.1 hypothetical protein QZH56_36925 [Streptomyces olivoreticuli]